MPGVTFKGAKDQWCCEQPYRREHSPNVFVNGIQVSRQGDKNTIHRYPHDHRCPDHTEPIKTGDKTVRVNDKGCGRVGDDVRFPCTWVIEGSTDVFAHGPQGEVTGPVPPSL